MTYLLSLAQERLGWPSREDVLEPKGVWPSILAETARKKISNQIQAIEAAARNSRIGILAANPYGKATEAPLAIVCEFARPVSDETVRLAQKLAWNFSWSPQLIIVEPHLIRSFTCCRPPEDDEDLARFEITRTDERGIKSLDQSPSGQAARSLHWINLISGKFFREREKMFKRNQRADHMLLENMKHLRKALINDGLDEGVCHDLLARIIFIQFLWDRKDSSGRAAINKQTLAGLSKQGVLSQRYSSLSEILKNKNDTYSLFAFLDEKFNGDLFAGIYKPGENKRDNLSAEKRMVEEKHLRRLADFIYGNLDMRSGQLNLWKYYSFDVIPLEFISSIYEEFLNKKKRKGKKKETGEESRDKGVHFTPAHIVDFMLDGVLPWDSAEWNIKILDPACGSAIFLVKAFQRLVHRWKIANNGRTPKVEDLRSIIENNLFGVDINPLAVRVASFSLYLAMCDELKPMHIWKQVRFPNLRDKRIICSDFFSETTEGFRTEDDSGQYDLIVGNAPWGKNSAKKGGPAKHWAQSGPKGKWPLTYNDIGPLFLPKTASLVKSNGSISMIMPTGSLLMNISKPALDFRKKLFGTFKIEEVVNLSAFRFGLYKDSISPSCIISFNKASPNGEPITYICPKLSATTEDDYNIFIEEHDVNEIFPNEAALVPSIWSILMWGARRDVGMINKLSGLDNLDKTLKNKSVSKRLGIIRGNRKKRQNSILGRRFLSSDEQLTTDSFAIFAENLPINDDPFTDYIASTDLSAFEPPQMIIKRSWEVGGSRFKAVKVFPDNRKQGILCSDSFVSIHFDNQEDLEAALLSYNSIIAVYYLLLCSGRFSSFVPTPTMKDLLSVPIPKSQSGLLNNISSLLSIDKKIKKAFGFEDIEWALIEDLDKITLQDFKGGKDSPGRNPTTNNKDDVMLFTYCNFFRRVLKAGFGAHRSISATIFKQNRDESLPVRLVAIHLDSPERDNTKTEELDNASLLETLNRLYRKFMDVENSRSQGVFFRRVFRIYDLVTIKGRKVPTVYLIKPDQVRYWTRSMAMRDADNVASDLIGWRHFKSDSDR